MDLGGGVSGGGGGLLERKVGGRGDGQRGMGQGWALGLALWFERCKLLCGRPVGVLASLSFSL